MDQLEEQEQDRPQDQERCEECGFVYHLDRAEAAARVGRALAQEMAQLLRTPGSNPRGRRRPQVWSPLEYGCHLRDVFLVQRERLLAARRVDRLELAPMGREERVEHDGYESQDPEDVARQLEDAALLFDGVVARLSAADWEREVVYPFPDPTPRTFRWVVVHTVHEAGHHLMDVRRQLD